ncbi:glycerophosphodiester phosphodiesterase [Lentibacillus salicampi]|uniref:Glycerophosphodiester phosphodiesterase n=1 Tax=Lentibacillus salicampi TaxID=175306 RepID=A0A4Y9A9T7_9BACI|nr:glycerophosphodiester phosphodiesterase [Lentibacillus salicampi]TFJ91650.1 glycerophosphodiester phosphodiesterase [Lentibacillus salicampi]
MAETKIYGHRGCMGTMPENTLIGFQKAIDQGADGLEIDVHMTKDGEIVVIHDETLDRTTNGSGYIKNHTLYDIKQYSSGINFSHYHNYEEMWNREVVPTLQEVLELLTPYDIELNIELKTYLVHYEGIEEKVLSLVHQYGNGRNVIYSSFHLPTMLRIKKLNPSANIAWLLNTCISHPCDYIKTMELEAFHIDTATVLSSAYYLKDLYLNIRVWTVNDSHDIKQLLDLNVNTIITDFPGDALSIRNERQTIV